MSTEPIRYDRLQVGLVSWVQEYLPSAVVMWAPTEYPRAQAGTNTIATLRILTGPDFSPVGGESAVRRRLATQLRYSVSGVVVGQEVALEVSGLRWAYTVQAGDGDGDARDALLALIGTEPLISATFAADGANDILVTAGEIGDLWCPRVRGAITVATETEAFATAILGEMLAQVELQTMNASRYLRSGATRDLTKVLGTVRTSVARGTLSQYGLSIGATPTVVNLDALSGPTWQSRAAATLQVTMPFLEAIPAPTAVQRVRGTLRVPPNSIDIDTDPP